MGSYNFSYASIDVVLENFLKIVPENQITLHWIFDSRKSGWIEKYKTFAETLAEEMENSFYE